MADNTLHDLSRALKALSATDDIRAIDGLCTLIRYFTPLSPTFAEAAKSVHDLLDYKRFADLTRTHDDFLHVWKQIGTEKPFPVFIRDFIDSTPTPGIKWIERLIKTMVATDCFDEAYDILKSNRNAMTAIENWFRHEFENANHAPFWLTLRQNAVIMATYTRAYGSYLTPSHLFLWFKNNVVNTNDPSALYAAIQDVGKIRAIMNTLEMEDMNELFDIDDAHISRAVLDLIDPLWKQTPGYYNDIVFTAIRESYTEYKHGHQSLRQCFATSSIWRYISANSTILAAFRKRSRQDADARTILHCIRLHRRYRLQAVFRAVWGGCNS